MRKSEGFRAPAAVAEDGPVSRRKLSDGVLERLLHLIESGAIPPGEQLPSERELMSVYRVGRPAVREALQKLEQRGLIAITHGERARVLSPTPDDVFEQVGRTARHMLGTSPDALEHLKQARLMFERAMVRIAAQKATEADIGKLRSALDALAAAPSGSREFIDADMRFHETIAGISGNPFFSAVSRAMLDWLTHFAIREVHQPGAESLTLSEHKHILACISNRDENGAVQAIEDHILRANELYRKLSASRPNSK